ncbi:MAG: hypothetical protein ACOYL6_12330 [Bacteriovoracaceae bacterium]
MKRLNTIFLLAVMGVILSACGKNNRVGTNGGVGGIFSNSSGIISQGQSTGSTMIDSFIAQVNCNSGYGNTRVFMNFTCSNGGCNRSGGSSAFNSAASSQLRLGRTAYGDVAIVNYTSANSAEMTFLMCQDGIFNQNTINNATVAGLQIMNSNVSSNSYGYGQFIANVWFGIQYSGSLIKASFY